MAENCVNMPLENVTARDWSRIIPKCRHIGVVVPLLIHLLVHRTARPAGGYSVAWMGLLHFVVFLIMGFIVVLDFRNMYLYIIQRLDHLVRLLCLSPTTCSITCYSAWALHVAIAAGTSVWCLRRRVFSVVLSQDTDEVDVKGSWPLTHEVTVRCLRVSPFSQSPASHMMRPTKSPRARHICSSPGYYRVHMITVET